MSGLWSSLNVGVQALAAFQSAMQTNSHNIANANTPGYSRQRAVFIETQYPDISGEQGNLRIGRGVTISSIERLRNTFLDGQYQNELASYQNSAELQQTYSILQTTFAEPSSNGLSTAIDRFFNAFQQMTVNPRDTAARAGVQQAGQVLAQAFQDRHTAFNNQIKLLNDQITAEAPEINDLTTQIDTLNRQITSLTAQGQIPNDLLDARELLVEKLTGLTGATVVNQRDGSISMIVNGIPIVDAAGAHTVSVVTRPGGTLGRVDLQVASTGTTLNFTGGTLKGQLDSRDVIVPQFDSQLDQLAQTLISQVNALHRQGYGLDGAVALTGSVSFTGTLAANASMGINGIVINFASGDDVAAIAAKISAQQALTGVQASVVNNQLVLSPVTQGQNVQITSDPDQLAVTLGLFNDFFSGTGSATIALSAAVAGNVNYIAASQSGAPGDAANASALAALRDALTMTGGTQTFSQNYHGTVTTLGAQAAAADQGAANQKNVMDQITTLQQNASGVSLDEEMVEMTKNQRAYEAASKVISTSDKMLETLMNMI